MNLAWSGGAALGSDYTVSVAGGTLSADRLRLTFNPGQMTATLT